MVAPESRNLFSLNLLFLLSYHRFAQCCSYHGFIIPILPGEMQLHTCRWIFIHNIPIQTCSSTEFIDSHQEVVHVCQQLWQTHYRGNTEMNPTPSTQFPPISCSRQESSLFSPAQSQDTSSISSFNATIAGVVQVLPLWGGPFTSKLKQYGSLWCIQSTIRIKSTPRCWALQDKES